MTNRIAQLLRAHFEPKVPRLAGRVTAAPVWALRLVRRISAMRASVLGELGAAGMRAFTASATGAPLNSTISSPTA